MGGCGTRGDELIVVTHDSSIARRAQRVGQMRDGRLLIKQDIRDGRQAAVPAGDPGEAM